MDGSQKLNGIIFNVKTAVTGPKTIHVKISPDRRCARGLLFNVKNSTVTKLNNKAALNVPRSHRQRYLYF